MPERIEPSDPTRLRLLDLVERHGTNLAAVSRAIGRNHAYLHQFVNRGTPKRLSYEVCQGLGEHFSVDWSVFWEGGRRCVAKPATRSSSGGAGSKASDMGGNQSFVVRLSLARLSSPYKTPAQFSAAMGIDRARYADLEDGIEEPSIAELDRISKLSGKSLDWLIRGLEQGTSDRTSTNRKRASHGVTLGSGEFVEELAREPHLSGDWENLTQKIQNREK
jgi:transcriptional regulator with XRE-family HTH domain